MIPGIGQTNDYFGINSLNNMLKNITDIQSALSEKLIKVSITGQVESSQSGMGQVVDKYA